VAGREETAVAQRRVLVVDDEPMVVDVLRRYLLRDGFAVDVARDGAAALAEVARHSPDLVILDLTLPSMDGLEVCRSLRLAGKVAILMVMARGEVEDRIRGLGMGADDYVVKPFSPSEIVARVHAILRRASQADTGVQQELRFPGLTVRPALHLVERDGRSVDLAGREYDLLLHLARNPRLVFSRDTLLDAVWGYSFAGEPSTVTVHVRRLREKIEPDPAHPFYIKTVWGLGYKFDPNRAADG
jgi:two-component system, OmpR family, response regulator ResD